LVPKKESFRRKQVTARIFSIGVLKTFRVRVGLGIEKKGIFGFNGPLLPKIVGKTNPSRRRGVRKSYNNGTARRPQHENNMERAEPD